jgi:hypothetical protein
MSELTDYQVDYNLPAGESVEDIDKGWVKRPDSESLGGGGLGLGDNATPKEATDNEKLSDARE